jgi:hypothetical protein
MYVYGIYSTFFLKIKIIAERYRKSKRSTIFHEDMRAENTWFRYTTGQAACLPLLIVVASAWPASPSRMRAAAASSISSVPSVRAEASASVRTSTSAAASSVAVVQLASPFPLLERRPCVASSVQCPLDPVRPLQGQVQLGLLGGSLSSTGPSLPLLTPLLKHQRLQSSGRQIVSFGGIDYSEWGPPPRSPPRGGSCSARPLE